MQQEDSQPGHGHSGGRGGRLEEGGHAPYWLGGLVDHYLGKGPGQGGGDEDSEEDLLDPVF